MTINPKTVKRRKTAAAAPQRGLGVGGIDRGVELRAGRPRPPHRSSQAAGALRKP